MFPWIFSPQAFADNLGIPFLETSAKNASNVEAAFLTMASELIRIRFFIHTVVSATGLYFCCFAAGLLSFFLGGRDQRGAGAGKPKGEPVRPELLCAGK